MAKDDWAAMTEVMKMAGIERDSKGAPIFEMDGEKLFYRGKSINGHLVWQSEKGQLVFRAPDFDTFDRIFDAAEFETVLGNTNSVTETEAQLGAIYEEANEQITRAGFDTPESADILTSCLEKMVSIMRSTGMKQFVVFHSGTGSCVINDDRTMQSLDKRH
jgi:hypothetical protein